MTKNTWVKPDPIAAQVTEGKVLGSLRLGVVTYEEKELREGGGRTLGQTIDDHILSVFEKGGLVNEVTLTFEGIDAQHQLRAYYVGRE